MNNSVVGIIVGTLFIVAGLILISFPKFGWKYDWGVSRKGKKYKKEDKVNSVISGCILIIVGLLFVLYGST